MGRSPAPIGADFGCLIGGVSIGVGFDSAYAAKLFRHSSAFTATLSSTGSNSSQ
jgi:hypothetical protein